MNAHPWRYGLLGLPLAFLALPLYVSLPAHYAGSYGVPLAQLGALLLFARFVDAALDPLIGRWCDGWLRAKRVTPVLCGAALLMFGAFTGLFFPPLRGEALLAWAAAMLVLGYISFSVVGVTHQAWGARLGGDAMAQTRLMAWREGLALVGVLVASVLISTSGWGLTTAVLALVLVAGLAALLRSPLPAPQTHSGRLAWGLPWRTPGFQRLLAVYALNGIAAAIPATVLLFFVRDRLQTPQYEALYLVSYFAAAAASMPLWLRAVARVGQGRAWLMGMGLAVISFVWAALLGKGDGIAFVAICIATGVAAGADLAIPPALLTRVIQHAELAGRAEGAFFGWWNAVTKLNLALAAGLALPLLQFLGYSDGARDPQALQALSAVYALLPCVLKLGAMALLWQLLLRGPARHTFRESLT
ncbi:MAG: MFS transporter [Burkholderiales bacterium]|uniref:MFS transporter n=1 Tax=Inhella sp. TaxID=1921806 RepID=UPI001AD0E268|nr:MFS transporter [Burkholderiales bacterium]